MGSYLGTCMASQLTIDWRTPCRIVFIRRRMRYGHNTATGFTGIDTLWQPITFPILGVYEDRNQVEKWDPNDWRVRDFLTKLDEGLIDRPKKDDRGCDPVTRPDAVDFGAIQLHCHDREDIEISRGRRGAEKGDQLGYVLIREDVYQGLLATVFTDYRGREVTIKTQAEQILDWFGQLCVAIDSAPEKPWEAIRDLDRRPRIWSSTSGQALEHFKHDFTTQLCEAVKDGDAAYKAFKTLGRARCYAMAEFLHFHAHLENLRKMWMPQAGAGAQDDGHQSAKALARIVQMSITKTDLGDEEDSKPFHDLFFTKFVPPQAFQVGREERMKLAEVVDTEGVAFLTEAVGDGDGYGSLFVVKNADDAYDYYIINYEEKTVEKYSHDKSLGGYEGNAMHEIPATLWPER